MITSKREEAKETQRLEFPCLRVNKEKNFIVLFESEIEGVVVYVDPNYAGVKMGSLYDWPSANDKNIWENYNGNVVLSNS